MKNTMVAKIIATIMALIIVVSFAAQKRVSASDIDQTTTYKVLDIPDDYTINGFTRLEAAAILQDLINNFGIDVALDVIDQLVTNGKSTIWSDAYKANHPTENIGIFLAGKVWVHNYTFDMTGRGF